MKVIEDPEAVAKLRSGGDREKNLEILQSEYQVSQRRHGLACEPYALRCFGTRI